MAQYKAKRLILNPQQSNALQKITFPFSGSKFHICTSGLLSSSSISLELLLLSLLLGLVEFSFWGSFWAFLVDVTTPSLNRISDNNKVEATAFTRSKTRRICWNASNGVNLSSIINLSIYELFNY